MQILPVILAGGRGTRLWPLSTDDMPKQFLRLCSDLSLMQETIARVKDLDNILPPVIISNERYLNIINKQLAEINSSDSEVLLEPTGRNTAPAITLAALYAAKKYNDPVLLVLPSDHYIEKQEQFINLVKQATEHAKQNNLVTFGIIPTNPATGYGYIQQGSPLAEDAFKVAKFTEKPHLELAKEYLASKNYYWNSGMFAFQTSRFLKAIDSHSPNILQDCNITFDNHSKAGNAYNFRQEDFSKCQSISVDYAVMEKTDSAVVIPADIGWSDVGGWQALWEISKKDENGNVIRGGNVTVDNVTNSFIHSDKNISLKGLNNMVAIHIENDALLTKK